MTTLLFFLVSLVGYLSLPIWLYSQWLFESEWNDEVDDKQHDLV